MLLTLPRSDFHNQVRITIRHPNWETTTTLDDSHKTFELTAPEGDDIDDIEVSAELIGPTGEVDAQFPPIPLKEKGHAKQTNDAGESGESNSSEPVSDLEHPGDSDAADAGVQADAAEGRVSEASDEQVTSTEALTPPTHHKPRRPNHA
jgi:hypothetical protein